MLSLLALGLAACSFSFKAGGDASTEAGKPAQGGDAQAEPSKPTRKPIAQDDPDAPTQPSEPTPPSEPTEDGEPTRTPPAEEPPPVVEPRLTAVCRVEDPSLLALCHRALDPIAADDVEAWAGQLGEGVVVTRPGFRRGTQRFQGPQAVRDAVDRAGGLRSMLHLRPTDRVVGTLSIDCRQCRRAFVAFEANTRSGTIVLGLELTQPPRIISVDVGARMSRRPLEPTQPTAPTPPAEPPTTLDPPRSTEIVAPAPKKQAE